jgi:hypothetical protein
MTINVLPDRGMRTVLYCLAPVIVVFGMLLLTIHT